MKGLWIKLLVQRKRLTRGWNLSKCGYWKPAGRVEMRSIRTLMRLKTIKWQKYVLRQQCYLCGRNKSPPQNISLISILIYKVIVKAYSFNFHKTFSIQFINMSSFSGGLGLEASLCLNTPGHHWVTRGCILLHSNC